MNDSNEFKYSDELRKAIIKYEKLKGLLEVRKKERGLDFYIPNIIQHRAHQSKAKIIAIVKGNRMGGSHWGAAEVCMHITGNYPSYFPEERKRKQPVKIRIATDKYSKINAVLEPKLRLFLPRSWWAEARIHRLSGGQICSIDHKSGTIIEFLTMEQSQMAFEGQDLDVFWGDEPVERNRYVATQRGLIDRGGLTLLTFTPLIEPWMKEEIVDKADGKTIEVFYGTTRDNLYDINGNPILREDDVKRFEDLLTEDERETRIYGKFFHLKGIVYKEFSPDVHLVRDFTYEEGYPVICVLDPHDRQPHHVIWAMIDRTDDVYVMHEMVKEGTVAELSASIKAVEKYYGWNVIKRLIDPNFGRKPLISTGLSVIQELGRYRLSFLEADDNKEAGRLKVKELLHYHKDKPLDINNKPKLFFVSDRCPKTIHSVRNLQYDEWKGNEDRDLKEDTKQKDTHGADCVRYLAASRPSFYLPKVYEQDLAGVY